MFFPLLEALLQRNSPLSKERVKDFYVSGDDPKLLFKAFFTYAAQGDTSNPLRPDPVVLCDALWKTLPHVNDELRSGLTERFIDWIVAMPLQSIDTAVLKPDPGRSSVVSVHEMTDAFEQYDAQVMLEAVRNVLQVMDNKQYFMEIMFSIALSRSADSIILAQATSKAIEVMDWRNNFTPFLIHHLVNSAFLDRVRFSSEP